jgi:hypothetical protein
MVCLRISNECEKGNHRKCKGHDKPPEGQYGGWKCTCNCHTQPSGFVFDDKDTVDQRLRKMLKEVGKNDHSEGVDGFDIEALRKVAFPLHEWHGLYSLRKGTKDYELIAAFPVHLEAGLVWLKTVQAKFNQTKVVIAKDPRELPTIILDT